MQPLLIQWMEGLVASVYEKIKDWGIKIEKGGGDARGESGAWGGKGRRGRLKHVSVLLHGKKCSLHILSHWGDQKSGLASLTSYILKPRFHGGL